MKVKITALPYKESYGTKAIMKFKYELINV